MKFFNEDDAAAIVDANAPSLTSLLYSTTPEDWRNHMGPTGAAKEWLSTGQVAPPPSWMTHEENETHIRIFKKGGYTGPLNWYVILTLDPTIALEFISVKGINHTSAASMNHSTQNS